MNRSVLSKLFQNSLELLQTSCWEEFWEIRWSASSQFTVDCRHGVVQTLLVWFWFWSWVSIDIHQLKLDFHGTCELQLASCTFDWMILRHLSHFSSQKGNIFQPCSHLVIAFFKCSSALTTNTEPICIDLRPKNYTPTWCFLWLWRWYIGIGLRCRRSNTWSPISSIGGVHSPIHMTHTKVIWTMYSWVSWFDVILEPVMWVNLSNYGWNINHKLEWLDNDSPVREIRVHISG